MMKEPVGKGVHCPSILRASLEMKSLQHLKMRAAETTGRGNRVVNAIKSTGLGKERPKRQDECLRQLCWDKEACNRKEEEMEKEKKAHQDKRKKPESTESIGSMEKTEKEEDTVERDGLRNKDRPAVQLSQPGAQSGNQLWSPEDSTKSGVSAPERKVGMWY